MSRRRRRTHWRMSQLIGAAYAAFAAVWAALTQPTDEAEGADGASAVPIEARDEPAAAKIWIRPVARCCMKRLDGFSALHLRNRAPDDPARYGNVCVLSLFDP